MRRQVSVISVIVLLCFAIAAFGCKSGGLTGAKPYKETQFLMDTVIEITAYGPNAESAVKEAFAEFKRLHNLTNYFDAGSQVSKVNQAAGRQKVVVDAELIAIIKRANQLSDQLDGAFDVTIGPLSELWGIGRKGDYIPSPAEISAVLPLVNYRQVEVNEEQHTIFLPKPGMKLDLGGIAKGYAADRAIDTLKAQGITSALVNAGGDVRVIGVKPDGQPWRIGVQHPRNTDGISAKLSLTNWDTMETSGDYQRYFISNGTRYSHILDPKTGYQPRQIASVTIVNNNSGDGDILSTAVFVLGVERGLELLKQFPDTEAIILTNDGKTVTTPGLTGKIELTAE